MNKRILISAFCLLCFIIGCKKKTDKQQADMVLINGNIVTMDKANPYAQALAIKKNVILDVGSDKKIKKYITDSTKVIDLQGYFTIPGLIEGHGHYMSLGESLMGIKLQYAKNWDEIIALVADAVKEHEPGEWIVGRGWHQDKWDKIPDPEVEGLPTHQSLSKVSPDNPVILIHVSGHGVFVNKKGLQESGVDSNTPDPEGGEIIKDNKGNPTGMLRETAQEFARKALANFLSQRPPELIIAEERKKVKLAAEEAIKNGITTFFDMGESFTTIDLFKKMAEEGNLPVRLYVAIQEPSEAMEGRLANYRLIGYGNNYLTVRSIGEKVLDGALGVHGGWLLEPYSDNEESTGFNVTPIDDIRRSAKLAIENDFQMAIQGIGDRAARELFDIYEKEFKTFPEKNDLRWRIEHCQVVHPDDVPRFAELGVIASIRGVFATSDGLWVEKRLGKERLKERGYLYQTFFQSGAVVMNGTDPPVEDINPVANFYCSVTRKMTNDLEFYPEQKMTREQALLSYTVNNAYAAFEENMKGTLNKGKLADITVLSKDLLTIPDDEILSTEVIYTIIDGKIKYQK